MRRITNDHSVAEEWVRQGRLTPEEAEEHPSRHQLTRTLGVEDDVQPDIFPLSVENGDRILLCSDGLSNELSDDEIASVASSPNTLDDAVATLIELANRKGGRDNITAILLEFQEDVAQPAAHEVAAPAPPPAQAADDTDDAEEAAIVGASDPVPPRRRRARRFTWRTALFFLAIAAVVAAAYAVIDWYEHSAYYLADDHGRIAVYNGQPGGFLWFKPVLVDRTKYEFTQLTGPARVEVLTHSDLLPTLREATQLAQNLHREWRSLYPPPTTTTTTLAGA
jgi:protein phosphatase